MKDYNSPEFWLDAPDWATHYLPAFEQYTHPIWLEMDGDTVLAAGHMGSDLRSFTYTKCIQPSTDVKRRVKRPAPKWSGDGNPPIGFECEYQRNDVHYRQEWVAVTPLYLGESIAVFRHSASGNEFTEMADSCVFRPIRTEAQIAAEERENVIRQMVKDSRPMNRREVCADLYDAGYRKQEKPE